MKNTLFAAACFCAFNTCYAQTPTVVKPHTATTKQASSGKCALSGTIRDGHNFPLNNVKVFIYAADSSIIASGYTDETGRYETNTVVPGNYNVKVVYPSQKATLVTDVALKSALTLMTVKADPPTDDTTMAYADIAPKAAPKKK